MLKYLKRPLLTLRQSATRALSNSTKTTATTTATGGRLIEVNKALNGWEAKLKDAGVQDTDFNLKCIVSHVLKRKFNTVPDDFSQLKFNSAQLADFERFLEARCARMPLQHIIGEWDFMDITLKTAPTVFIPRPETEEFVRLVIDNYKRAEHVNMLEVGCGSGAMSLSMLHALPQVQATAIERSKAATALAWENAKLLGLQQRFEVHNHTMETDKYMPESLHDKRYDLIISNPPYVKTDEFQYLHPEVVVYENLNALDGGSDGLRVARLVFDLACVHLRPGGKLWLELGNEHPPLVKTIMHLQYEGRLKFVQSYQDQYKRERFVQLEKV
ncbi:MTRF1L release factor glutamine methyltransferase [Drosophila grimshawi]|uniref:peptide chain release factor N(5)-glutamine methyltransferase n=1 Tax=Drosophila grimshawi TaxID=7222 RepID=B4JR61_DROGR|nr:MTRF1L release factor glutamine methyltransferase [Drosophila grimshawi]EDV99391.1 GH13055 [Drosophila grimshawi]